MKTFTHFVVVGCCAIAAGCAAPGSGVSRDFPPDAQPIAAQALKERLSGRSFTASQANGIGWDMNYGVDGRFTMQTSNGHSDQGRWRTEDNKLCIAFEGQFPSGCSEMRASPNRLHLKRASNGEVVALDVKP